MDNIPSTQTQLKTCSRCKREKPRTEFYRKKSNPDGLKYWCKACCAEYQKGYWPDYYRLQAVAVTLQDLQ